MLNFRLVPAVVGLSLLGAASAQQASIPYAPAESNIDSGYIDNATSSTRVVFSTRLKYDQAVWLQFRFGEATNLPDGSFLRMTSALDQAVQRHYERSLADYRMWSAAFNGDDVLLELVAGPNTRANHVVVALVHRGLGSAPSTESICGSVDNRVLSTDPRQGRMFIGCTGWFAGQFGAGAAVRSIMLSAGHCVSGGPFMIETNVPLSTAGGSIVRAHPDDQYPFTVVQSLSAGVGADWSVSTTGANSNTGLVPTQANGGTWYNLGAVPGSTAGQNIRITGYGSVSSPVSPTWQLVQKTHVGPLANIGATSLGYATDTTGGNSGSPVIHENSGNSIGIHTHGGCNSQGWNSGTRIDRSDIQNALAGLGRVPGVFSAFGAGCVGSGTGPNNCASQNAAGGTSSQTTAPNEYAYGFTAGSALAVTGFKLFTGTNTGSSTTVTAAIYADNAGLPAVTALATTTMTVGSTVGWYQATFGSTLNLTAGQYYVSLDHSATSTYLSNLTSGSSGVGYWRRPPLAGTWARSGLINFPAYQIMCAGGGGAVAPAIGNSGLPEVGRTFRITLSQAAGGAPATLFTGFSNTVWSGGGLPWSLGFLGAPGCNLLVDPKIAVAAVANGSGAASLSVPVPNDPTLIGQRAYHQWFVIDAPANSLGIAVSNGGRSTIGG